MSDRGESGLAGVRNQLTRPHSAPTDCPFPLKSTFMGQQLNKIEKRRRRANYLERLKTKAKEAAVSKPKARRAPAKKAEAPAPAPAAAAAE